MNTHEKGNLALLKAISWFQANGYAVFVPIGHSAAVDIVVAKPEEKAQRVQCKWAGRLSFSARNNPAAKQNYSLDLRSSPKRTDGKWGVSMTYTSDSFDLLFVSCPVGDFLFPWTNERAERSNISLGKLSEKYKLS